MLKLGWNDGHTLSGTGTGAAKILSETDRNRRIGSKTRAVLLNEYEGIEIVNCTIDKSSNDMSEAVSIANKNKVDVFISNHVNAGGGKGIEGFYSRYASSTSIEKGKKIYNKLVATKSCLAARRFTDDFSYKKYDLYVLKNTNMEAFLFEIGFVDNQECVNAINDDEIARAYAEGIAEAYRLKKKAPAITYSAKCTDFKITDSREVGKEITISAKADTTAALFKYWIQRKSNNEWIQLTGFIDSTSIKHTFTTIGDYLFVVHVKHKDSKKDYDDRREIALTITDKVIKCDHSEAIKNLEGIKVSIDNVIGILK